MATLHGLHTKEERQWNAESSPDPKWVKVTDLGEFTIARNRNKVS